MKFIEPILRHKRKKKESLPKISQRTPLKGTSTNERSFSNHS
jgi:hypothetical protein